jgi:uncharacterized protein YjbI with pentapeptide repeats
MLQYFGLKWLAAAGLAIAAIFPASASAKTCQAVLAEPDAVEDGVTPTSEFGPGLIDIDGAKINSPDALRAALADTKGKVPIVKGGDFSGWNFARIGFSVTNICFFQSKLARTIWDYGAYPGIGFIEADLASASFRNARLENVLLRESFLTDANMQGARLESGLFDGGWGGGISNWNLSGASLRGFRFECGLTLSDGCPLDRSGVKLVNADLSDADLSTYPFWGQADYSGATLEMTKVSPRHLTDIVAANVKNTVILKGGESEVALSASEFAELQHQAVTAKAAGEGPSFPCARAGSDVEKLICGEHAYGLHGWDRMLAQIYADLKARDPSIAQSQRKWLAGRRICKDEVCLSKLYDARVKELRLKLGEPELLERGESALFIFEAVAFPDAFRNSELFKRIVPVLVDASLGEAVVERAADGSYSISGESIAANAHMCSVSGENLRFDRNSGWFSAFDPKSKQPPAAVFQAYRDQIDFPASGHPTEEEYPGSSDFASCGARASLMQMRRIDVPRELTAKKKAMYNEGY